MEKQTENQSPSLMGKLTLFVLAVLAILAVVMAWNWAGDRIDYMTTHPAPYRGKEEYGIGSFILLFVVGLFRSAWVIINFPTNWLLGDNLIDLMLELMVLVLFISIIAGILVGPAKLLAKLFRRRLRYSAVFFVVAAMLVLPHFYMSWNLRHYKSEFKIRAMGSSSEDFSGVEPGESGRLDYGGKLDELVGARMEILIRNQYIPLGTASWRTNGLTTHTAGAYIYTFMPSRTYNRALIGLGRFLGGNIPDTEKALREMEKDLRKPMRPLKRSSS